MNVLLLDFWSEKNRGDAAMQMALVGLVRRRLPGARVTVMAASGANQWPDLRDEYDHTLPLVDEYVGGLRIWLTGPYTGGPLRRAAVRKLTSGLCSLMSVWLLLMMPLVASRPALDRLLPARLRPSVRAVRSADLVLWNCRNIVGSGRTEPYQVWARLFDAMAAILMGRPTACVGASVWPLRSGISRRLVRWTLARCIFISTRDAASLDYLAELLAGAESEVRLVPDLSLALLCDLGVGARSKLVAPSGYSSPRRIGLTIVDNVAATPGARRRYAAALCDYLSEFLGAPDTEAVIIPQVTTRWQPTDSLRDEIVRGLDPARIKVIAGEPRVEELVELYRGLDLLIATRMHSAIFALAAGTPAVTIPYMPGAKWGILEMLGARDLDVPYATISAEALRGRVADLWDRRDELRTSSAAMLPGLGLAAAEHVEGPLRAAGLASAPGSR